MIISRTPFRVSLAGGGTDLKAFYRHEPGFVVSTAIDKYMYITVNRRFDRTIRVSYSKTEIVSDISRLRHPLVRESLRLMGIRQGIEITSIADLPAGSGMGSSSSFTVGLLKALHAFKGRVVSPDQLAREACSIEIDRLNEPIGKQDQYAAAFGGFRRFSFQANEKVTTMLLACAPQTRRALERTLMLFYVASLRRSRSVLAEQQARTPGHLDTLRGMKTSAQQLARVLETAHRAPSRLQEIGEILHESWRAKRTLARGVSTPRIDQWYVRARRAGAIGGKLLGAGGGGFLLMYVPESKRSAVRASLGALRHIPFRLEPQGSQLVYTGGT